MKKISKIFIFSALILSGMMACKKEEKRVIFQGGTAPVLTASVADSIPLDYADANLEALKLSWTNPNYQFNTGISSLDVNYNIEIDTAGSNFTNLKKAVVSMGTNLSQTFLESEINNYLFSQLKLQTGVSHNIEIRVTAALVGGQESLISNVVKLAATPYAIPPKVTPPASGNLYIVGDAVSAGWPGTPVQDYSLEKFTQISPTDYQLTITLNSKGTYKLVEIPGQWDEQWSIKTTQASASDPSTLNFDLYFNGANAMAPLAAGTYKIEVDFQSGKVTLTK